MNRRNTLYMQKAAIAAAVYLVLRYLLPLVFPFFFAWLTVAALNRFRHRISMRLVPLSAGVLSTSLSSAERLSSLSTHPGTFSGVAGLPFTYAASV